MTSENDSIAQPKHLQEKSTSLSDDSNETAEMTDVRTSLVSSKPKLNTLNIHECLILISDYLICRCNQYYKLLSHFSVVYYRIVGRYYEDVINFSSA